jgi:hypothetical protein
VLADREAGVTSGTAGCTATPRAVDLREAWGALSSADKPAGHEPIEATVLKSLTPTRLQQPVQQRREAGRTLFVSETSIKTYVMRLLTKLDITNRTQAAILEHEAGLFDRQPQ